MKKYILNTLSIAIVAVLTLASCNDYLDKLPDDRAELNTTDNVVKLMMDAYPTTSAIMLMELSSDNYADNGSTYSTSILMDEIYQWKDITDDGGDSPYAVWNGHYAAIGAANQALEAAKSMPKDETVKAAIAEGRLCRAYNMFVLANVFCMAWNPEKADEYLGLPYPKEPVQDVTSKFDRGTLRELYASIDEDIEAALPDLDDNLYKTAPKYHFNLKAAFAFAARFNLYYMNYEKAIAYATKALGDNPKAVLRDFVPYIDLGSEDMAKRWFKSSESANFLLLPSGSTAGRCLTGYYARFQHNSTICQYETFWPEGPWGSGSSNNTLYYSHNLYGSSQCVMFPTLFEQFEVTDKINQIGYPHIVDAAFTGDETLLVRAEAYALTHQNEKCIEDLNLWLWNHCYEEYYDVESNTTTKRPVLTVEDNDEFWNDILYTEKVLKSNRDRTIRKHLNPQGFTIDEGSTKPGDDGEIIYLGSTQENLIQMVLHMRRMETLFHGLRFIDNKRYGMEYSHNYSRREPMIFEAGDLRGAIQIPQQVIQAGITPNPRKAQEPTEN